VTDLPAAGTTTADAQLDGAVWVAAELDEIALESCSLRRLRGSGGAWTRSSFVDCTFDGADLAGLVTSDCSLVRSTLDGARLSGSQWLRSRWRGVTGSDLVADAVSAHGSTWTDVTLTSGRLRELDLTDARLERVAFLDCDLREARFHAARCVDVRLIGCQLAGVVGVGGLRAATLGWSDAVGLLPSLARELGITVLDDDTRAGGD
jgi:uncharacterized protein YjbI with pentapeptide repeats